MNAFKATEVIAKTLAAAGMPLTDDQEILLAGSVAVCMEKAKATATGPAPSGTEARVIADIARRQQLGIAKYGATVAETPLQLRAWLQHAYEESLDLSVYLRRAIEEMDRQP